MPAFRSAGTAVEVSGTMTMDVEYTLTAGDLLCLLHSVPNNPGSPTSVVSDVDGALTPVDWADAASRVASLYVLENATAGAHTITVTYAANQTMAGIAFGVSSVDMGTSFDGAVDAEGASGTTDLDISVTSPSGDLALAVAVTASATRDLTLDNGTVHVDTNTTNFGLYVCSRAGQGGATSIDGAFDADTFGWSAVAANINAGGGLLVSRGRLLEGQLVGASRLVA